jgi:hypothetical protein
MKKCNIIFVMVLLGFYVANGQQVGVKKSKSYEVWVMQSNNDLVTRGILYEIRDSSICVARSIYDTEMTVFKFDEIDKLKIRKVNNVRRGIITGSLVGAAVGVVIVNSIPGGISYMTIPFSAIAGLFTALPGAGIGAAAGAIRDNIPLKQDYGNFNKYRGCLQDYSFVEEPAYTGSLFRHRFYASGSMGISAASGELADKIAVTDYPGMHKTGLSLWFGAGYRISDFFGVKFSLIEDSYALKDNDGTMSWALDAFMLCPVITFPFINKIRIGLEPGIGFASATLANENEFLMNGTGLGMGLNGTIVYDYAKRWAASANIGYLHSNQKFKEGGSGKASTIDLQLGVAYKFGKKSL